MIHENAARGQVGCNLCFINVLFGARLIAAPWLLDDASSALAVWNGMASGALLIVLSIPRGPVRDSYGGWERYIY